MDKGIRQESNRKFAEMLPLRAELGNTGFRKSVIMHLVEQFGISIASAATHYNHSFQQAKINMPEQVEGLGRPPEKNNGGRKKKVVVQAPVDAEFMMQASYEVRRKDDDSVIATELNFEHARNMVECGVKGELYWV